MLFRSTANNIVKLITILPVFCQLLQFPSFVILVEVSSVHEFVLLFVWNEVFDYQHSVTHNTVSCFNY